MTSTKQYSLEEMQRKIGGKDAVALFLITFAISFIFRAYIIHFFSGENQVLATRYFLVVSAFTWISFTSISHSRHPVVEILSSLGISALFIPIVGLFLYCSMSSSVDYDYLRWWTIFCVVYLIAQAWIFATYIDKPAYEAQFLVVLLISIVVSFFFAMIFWIHLRFFTHNDQILSSSAARKDFVFVAKAESSLVCMFIFRLFMIGIKKAINDKYKVIVRYRPREDYRHSLILNLSRVFIRFWIYFVINPIHLAGVILAASFLEVASMLFELFKSKHILIAAKIIATCLLIFFMTQIAINAADNLINYISIDSNVRSRLEFSLILKLALSFAFGWLSTIALAVLWIERLRPTLDDCLFKCVVLLLAWLVCGTALFMKAQIWDLGYDEHFGLYLIFGWGIGLFFFVQALRDISNSDATGNTR